MKCIWEKQHQQISILLDQLQVKVKVSENSGQLYIIDIRKGDTHKPGCEAPDKHWSQQNRICHLLRGKCSSHVSGIIFLECLMKVFLLIHTSFFFVLITLTEFTLGRGLYYARKHFNHYDHCY